MYLLSPLLSRLDLDALFSRSFRAWRFCFRGGFPTWTRILNPVMEVFGAAQLNASNMYNMTYWSACQSVSKLGASWQAWESCPVWFQKVRKLVDSDQLFSSIGFRSCWKKWHVLTPSTTAPSMTPQICISTAPATIWSSHIIASSQHYLGIYTIYTTAYESSMAPPRVHSHNHQT